MEKQKSKIQPSVDIIITCYNCENYLHQCFSSVISQSYSNWKIIFVNDKSDDSIKSTLSFLIDWYNLKKRILVISHNKNMGYGKSLKDGIDAGDGELIAIVDSDDSLASNNALKLMVGAHKRNPKASLIYSDYYSCDEFLNIREEKRSTVLTEGKTYLGGFSSSGKYLGSCALISHFKTFKRSFYEKTEGLDPDIKKGVDKDLILKLEEVGELVHIPYFLYFHRRRAGSISSTFKNKNKTEKNALIDKKIEMYMKAGRRRGIIK